MTLPAPLKCASALAALSLFALPALALPTTTLTLMQPSGVTNGLDAVPIWVTLAVDADADGPLVVDGSTTSFGPGELDEFSRVDFVGTSASASCSTSFWPQPPMRACFDATSAWKFSFNYGDPSFLSGNHTLAPGQSASFVFGHFTPQNGQVAPGVYSSSDFSFTLDVSGLDQSGAEIHRYFTLSSTCDSGEPSCAFTREVIAVPEPATYASMALGLAFIGGFLARRRRASSAA